MIISRTAMYLNELCPALDRKIKSLPKIILNRFGDMFAQNRDCVVGVSRVPQSILDIIPLQDSVETINEEKQALNKHESKDFIIEADEINKTLKKMPKKSSYNGLTDFLAVGQTILSKIFDGSATTIINMQKLPISDQYDKNFSKTLYKKFDTGSHWISLNRKRFLTMVNNINKIMETNDDMDEILINIDLQTKYISIKGKNIKTKQMVFGVQKGERIKNRQTKTERIFFND